jgi:hypothetical protein
MTADHSGSSRFTQALGLLLILLAGGFLFHSQLSDFDLWWHLAGGRWIAEHHTIPRLDPFSFTSSPNEWIDLHWLFQLLIYGAYRLAGPEGLILLQTLFFSATLLLVLRYGYQARFGPAAIFGGLVYLLVGAGNFVPRPYLLTFFLVVLILVLLDFHRRHRGREIYWLAPLMLLWSNCHSLFVMGLALIAAWWVGEFLDHLRSRQGRDDAPYLARLAAAAVLAGAVCTVNPYGVNGLLFPLLTYTRISGALPIFRHGVTEFAPPLAIPVWVGSVFFFKVALGLLALTLLAQGRKIRTAEVLITLVFSFVAFKAVRNLGLWSVPAGAILGRNLGELWQKLARNSPARAERWRPLLTSLLGLVLLAHFPIWAVPQLRHRLYGPSQFGRGLLPGQFPEGAADFMAAHPPHGRGFNCFEDGGYLIWRMFPGRQVFFDTRLEVHDQVMFATYQLALRDPHHLAVVLDRFHLDWALLRHDAAWPAEALALDPAWAPVFLDDVAVLLVRRSPEHADLIRRSGIDLKRLRFEDARSRVVRGGFEAEGIENLGVFFLQVGRTDLARTLFQEAAAAGPGQARAELFLGLEALNRGQLEEARNRLETALPGSPENRTLIHSRLAELAESEGAYDRAVAHWRRALAGEVGRCDWRERLGQDLIQQGRPAEAALELEASLACPAPAAVMAKRWGDLAVAWAEEKLFPEAEQAARAALRLDPDLKAAQRLLDDLLRRKGKL